jgi:DNA polymerase III sliding clamp (beta) subunit (PCNA family)
MLEEIKFVRGAVKDRDSVAPVLTHFCISDGRIQGTNGRVYLDVPCRELDFEAVVPAEKFLRAVDACDGAPTFRKTDGGKLVIERKPFKAFLPILPRESYPHALPTPGKKIKCNAALPLVLRKLLPFIGTDASRPWAGTVAFDSQTGNAFAGNNATVAVCSADKFFTEYAQIPLFAIDEILRVNEPPTHYCVDESSMTFFWEDRWLKTCLITDAWPIKTVVSFLDFDGKRVKLPAGLRRNIERITPFCIDPKFPVIYFSDKGIATQSGESQAEIAGINIGSCVLRADNLYPVLDNSTHACVTDKAVLFWGDGFRAFMAPLKA